MPRTRSSTPRRSAAQRFSIRLQPSTGLTTQQEEAFSRLLAEYLAAREITAEGTHLHMKIQSAERELGIHDLADLACWIMDQPAIGAIHINMIGVLPTSTATPWSTASRSDRAVGPLIQLYRMGRIHASAFFEVLTSFQPRSLELDSND